MNKKEEKILWGWLFLTQELESFVVGQVAPLLKKVVVDDFCICDENLDVKTRKLNCQRTYFAIRQFLFENLRIADILDEYAFSVGDLMVFYVFTLTKQEKYKKIDIFKNKKSICFKQVSIFDVMTTK